VLIDGLHFRDHVILLALGIAVDGQKHVLALREGTTENATVCKALLRDLRERGLALDQPTLFIVDGGTGLRKAIREHCGRPALVHRGTDPDHGAGRWPRAPLPAAARRY
jgi:transposase-like protein